MSEFCELCTFPIGESGVCVFCNPAKDIRGACSNCGRETVDFRCEFCGYFDKPRKRLNYQRQKAIKRQIEKERNLANKSAGN